MKITPILIIASLSTVFAVAQDAPLPTPGFHHLHLNSPDPEAEIAFYTKYFTTTERGMFDGKPALKALKVWLLFNKVATKAPMNDNPQTAVWHYGWNSTDERAYLAKYREMKAPIMPLWTGFGDEFVQVSSDGLPGLNGTLGRTRKELEEGKARGDKPNGGAGFGYLQAPDGSPIEFAGNYPTEYFNHVHMYQDEPLCAVLWYQKHLNVAPRPARGNAPTPTEATCKQPRGEKTFPALAKDGMYRAPSGGVNFGGVAMNWYIRPGDTPLTSTLGHQADHIALSVGNLDAWLAKLKGEGVKILKEPYKFADTRAFMIEGPSKEALELVEVK
jgi:catechol 2,3-dioxygenase-like lactoylglutathione lyase family enzyme/predicted enzyme related to lactoylglutathione lyase